MAKRNPPQAAGKYEISIVCSSAAEYLTFVATAGQGGVEAVFVDQNVWLTQKMMSLLYDADVQTINYHLKKVFSDNCRRWQKLRHPALQPGGHHRRGLQGEFRARRAVPQVGHRHYRVLHHQGLCDG